MITASHNPFYYNGYKIKGPFGGSAAMDIIEEVEKEVGEVLKNIEGYREFLYPERIEDEAIKKVDFFSSYRQKILGQVDREVIEGFDFGLLLEPMYGATQGILIHLIPKIFLRYILF